MRSLARYFALLVLALAGSLGWVQAAHGTQIQPVAMESCGEACQHRNCRPAGALEGTHRASGSCASTPGACEARKGQETGDRLGLTQVVSSADYHRAEPDPWPEVLARHARERVLVGPARAGSPDPRAPRPTLDRLAELAVFLI